MPTLDDLRTVVRLGVPASNDVFPVFDESVDEIRGITSNDLAKLPLPAYPVGALPNPALTPFARAFASGSTTAYSSTLVGTDATLLTDGGSYVIPIFSDINDWIVG